MDELVAGEEFSTAVKALAAGELDPYQAADRLLPNESSGGGSGTVRPWLRPSSTVERRPDGVALIRLDRPKANALSAAVLAQLHSIATGLHDDPPGAVVLWGGRRISPPVPTSSSSVTAAPSRGSELRRRPRRAGGGPPGDHRRRQRVRPGRRPGAGLGLRLPCLRRGLRFGLPEVLLGVIPGGGGTQRLPRLIGSSRAKELIFSGRQVRAEEAVAIGLVNRVVPPDEVLDAALAWAAELATGAVLAHGLAKSAVDGGLETTLAAGLDIERDAFVAVARTEDAARGIASFRENGPGKATFVGR